MKFFRFEPIQYLGYGFQDDFGNFIPWTLFPITRYRCVIESEFRENFSFQGE